LPLIHSAASSAHGTRSYTLSVHNCAYCVCPAPVVPTVYKQYCKVRYRANMAKSDSILQICRSNRYSQIQVKYGKVTCWKVWQSQLLGKYGKVRCRQIWQSQMQANMVKSDAGKYGKVRCRQIWQSQMQANMAKSDAGKYGKVR
jgi:hypothetical protein